MVHAQINGKDAMLIADSGAFFSIVTPSAAAEFRMPPDTTPQGLSVWGVDGREEARVVRAKTFSLTGINKTWKDLEFIVAGSDFGSGSVGLLGQNFFRIADVEYDLANGVIRLAEPSSDCKNMPLAYWAAAAQKPYSVIDIDFATAAEPHTKGVAYLNGVRIRVAFDTGATVSILTLGAAKRAGITPTSEGVKPGGSFSGLRHRAPQTWITRFSSFRIGDEEIQHAQLRFGDVDLLLADMLIGADFFLSHRIYVANSQRRLYFTYNGGPVFDLAATHTPAESPQAGSSPELPAEGATPPDAAQRLDLPTDADGYARRGAASAARHDYDAALADLTRACELAPTNATYFFQRGMLHWSYRQPDLALTDFDQAIRLKPDDADALVARASLRAGRHESAQAIVADLDAADRALPKDAASRVRIGELYESVEQAAAAVSQYTKWIDSHPREDPRMAVALNDRCWARALDGQELQQALADCNAALKLKPETAAFLDSRGLVYLRLGNYDRAIADYDAALHLRPKIAWSLYGRGLARMHKGLQSEGHADVAAATALQPKIAQYASKHGINP
jgi:tetratricopeptide (TPR) repeat protein/predicted aspartyl protease